MKERENERKKEGDNVPLAPFRLISLERSKGVWGAGELSKTGNINF